MIYRFIYVLSLFLFFSSALEATILNSNQKLSYSIELLVDPSNKLTLEEAKNSKNYVDVPKHRLGFIDHTAWFHVRIKQSQPLVQTYILTYDFPNIENLIAYQYINNEKTQTLYFGTDYPPKEYLLDYEQFITPLNFQNTDQLDYYFKIKHFGSIPIFFSIHSAEEFFLHSTESKLVDGFLYGILFVMVLYNLVLYLFTRYSYYLYYISLVLSSLVYHASIRGFTNHYIWPNSLFFTRIADTLAVLIFILFGVLFIIKLLGITRHNYPKIRLLFIAHLTVITLLLTSTVYFELFSTNDTLGLKLTSISLIPILSLFIFIIGVAYYLAIRKERTAILFSIAWSFFTLALIVFVLQMNGTIPSFSWSNNLLAIGSVSEVILLAIILGDKINTLKEDNVSLEYSNTQLESLVDDRTKELQHQLYTDQLSGLQNRFALVRTLKETDNNLIMLIDINGFSQINDLYGIQVGNQILQQFSHKLQELLLNEHLIPYRLGADEFILLTQFEYAVSIESYLQLAQKLHTTIEAESYNIEEINESIELSITIAVVQHQTNILNKADMTLLTARKEGKKVLLYQDSFDHTHQLQKNLYYKKEIRLALEEDRFVCFFQPIISSVHTTQKYELLMRLEQFENGTTKIISPYEFLDISIKTNQYEKLSRYVLEKGIKSVSDLECDITLNLSFIEIKNPEFRVWFKALLQEHDMFDRVVLEILEDANLEDYQLMREFCQEFQGYGARIAIDDFGSGFSNFTHIMELRPNYIKIDGSIIKNIHNDPHSYSVVKAIVLLAKEIDAKTVAEFVHCEEVYLIVKELGVDEFQGYFIAEPQPLF